MAARPAAAVGDDIGAKPDDDGDAEKKPVEVGLDPQRPLDASKTNLAAQLATAFFQRIVRSDDREVYQHISVDCIGLEALAGFVEVLGQGDFPLDQNIVETLVLADVREAPHK